MANMLSAKGKDLYEWRAAAEFAGRFRDAMLERSATCAAGEAGAMYAQTIVTLENLASTYENDLARFNAILAELDGAVAPEQLRQLMLDGYAILYRQMELFHATQLFYNLSMKLLCGICTALTLFLTEKMGLGAGRTPTWSLVALGPAGRSEYSPFCPLQLLLLHAEATPSEREALALFGRALHDGFEKLGLRIDPVVSPRNPDWVGSLNDWRHRLESGLEHGEVEDLIELLRLTDLNPLCCGGDLSAEFRRITLSFLEGNRPAVTNLVERMSALSNGLGMMGKLKLEKSAGERGLFRLLDHGLLPLSAAVSVMALLKDVHAVDTPKRIRALLAKRDLNVDMAERMLQTWHTLHELRLLREQGFEIASHSGSGDALYIDPEKLTVEQHAQLHEALESVAAIQRYVYVLFTEAGE